MRSLPVAALAGLTVLVAACAGGGGGTETTSRPLPTRGSVRVGNAAAIEMYTEASRGARTVAMPMDTVWEVLPEVFEALEVPVTRRVPSLMEMGNLGYVARRVEGKRMNTFVDCGSNLSGQLANLYEITLSLVIRLKEDPAGNGTVVETVVDAWGEPRTTSGNPIHCQSRETLERRVGELVVEKLRILP